jgi:hypothetical protein
MVLTKIGLIGTLTAVVGISSYKIMALEKRKMIGRLVGYYLVFILVVLWFLGLGAILAFL